MSDQEIIDAVDEIVDDLNPPHIESVAETLGITVDALMERITTELKSRL